MGACSVLVQLLLWKKLIGTFITIVKPQQVNVFRLDLGSMCMLECYVTMRSWRRLDNFKERIWKNPIQHMPVGCYAMIALVIGRCRKQIPMSLLSSDLIVKQRTTNNFCFKLWVLPHPSLHMLRLIIGLVSCLTMGKAHPWLQDIHKMCDCTRLYTTST